MKINYIIIAFFLLLMQGCLSYNNNLDFDYPYNKIYSQTEINNYEIIDIYLSQEQQLIFHFNNKKINNKIFKKNLEYFCLGSKNIVKPIIINKKKVDCYFTYRIDLMIDIYKNELDLLYPTYSNNYEIILHVNKNVNAGTLFNVLSTIKDHNIKENILIKYISAEGDSYCNINFIPNLAVREKFLSEVQDQNNSENKYDLSLDTGIINTNSIIDKKINTNYSSDMIKIDGSRFIIIEHFSNDKIILLEMNSDASTSDSIITNNIGFQNIFKSLMNNYMYRYDIKYSLNPMLSFEELLDIIIKINSLEYKFYYLFEMLE